MCVLIKRSLWVFSTEKLLVQVVFSPVDPKKLEDKSEEEKEENAPRAEIGKWTDEIDGPEDGEDEGDDEEDNSNNF